MITTTKEAQENYLAKVVRLKEVTKLENSDFLQKVEIDFQTVITGLDAKDGAIYIYFPIESKISSKFLRETNSYSDYKLNKDYLESDQERKDYLDAPENKKERVKGYFDESGRVRATKMRGTKSMGYIVPVQVVKEVYGEFSEDNYINVDFDTINGELLVEKYVPKVKNKSKGLGTYKKEIGEDRLVEGQTQLHKNTPKLEPNAWRISPHHIIGITDKTHGTSWWVSNVKVKRKLTWIERVLIKMGVAIQETEYDYVYGSRNKVRNKTFLKRNSRNTSGGYDLWKDIADQVKSHIPKGFTLYGEAIGYTKGGALIQKGYDYGCKEGEMKLEVYRITKTNDDGQTIELSHDQITQFCEEAGLVRSKSFYHGKAYWILPEVDVNDPNWTKLFIERLRTDYLEKDCPRCVNKVPNEGIILRVDDLFEYAAFKLKSFKFLEWETKELDKGEVDIETEN